MVRSLFLIIVLAALFGNCSTDMKTCTQQVDAATLAAVDQTKLALDVIALDAYLAANNITTAIKDGAMRYVITTAGTGKTPCLESAITVIYAGRLMAPPGTTFDSSVNPVTFQLSALILGWKLGFLKLSKGGSATLYIPSGYAYGKNSQTGIPANSNLIFDVQLVDITF